MSRLRSLSMSLSLNLSLSMPPLNYTQTMRNFTGKEFEFAAGTVRGLRRWDIRNMPSLRGFPRDDMPVPDLRLKGAFSQLWQPGINEAICKAFPLHQPPVEFNPDGTRCGCGFWAYWKPHQNYGGRWTVTGIIEGWGRTLIGEDGFRCQKAKILTLVPDFDLKGRFLNHEFHLSPYNPGFTPEQEQFIRDGADAWMAVIQDWLGLAYPEARIFATVKGMLASVQTGEYTGL